MTTAEKEAGPNKLFAAIARFTEKHGYTWRSFVVAALVFPPAALFIVIKHPTWPRWQRALALLGLVTFLAVIPFVGGATVAFAYSAIKNIVGM